MASRRKLLVVALLAAIIGLVIVFATGIVVLPSSQSSGSVTSAVVEKSSCEHPPGTFLIIADISGFNDSVSHGAPLHPWPVIRVQQDQTVRIVVCNKDLTQPHGFAISTYFPTGVAIAPGEAYTITFTATVPGNFVMYCNIFCTVHVFMVAQLIVQPK